MRIGKAFAIGCLASLALALPLQAEIGDYLFGWGSQGSAPGQLHHPQGLAVDSQGNLYVVEAFNHRVQVFDRDGNYLRQWYVGGPRGLGVGTGPDGATRVYVADSGNSLIQVFDSSGAFLRSWGGWGTGDGQFQYPFDAAVDAVGNVFVPDYETPTKAPHRVQVFDASGAFLTSWGGAPGPDLKAFATIGSDCVIEKNAEVEAYSEIPDGTTVPAK